MQDMTILNIIFYVAVLLLSVIIHEVAHGLAARKLGDRTAEHEGRLTLNPIPHIDPLGTVILPLLLALSNAPFMIGWAKPVPYNPYNFRPEKWILRWGEAFVAFAGPLSNIIIFSVFGLFLRFFEQFLAVAPFLEALIPAVPLISMIVVVNIALAVFNLMPFPPLDGSKIFFSIFPRQLELRAFLERHQLIIALFFILFLWKYVSPLIFVIYRLLIGV